MIKEVLYLLIALVGVPTGIILEKLCKEEIGAWKRRFTYIIIVCLVLIPVIYVVDFQYKIPIITALAFLIITLMTVTLELEKGL